jgi:non-haem Fe2+, alpha-ketoglutarate-dependent halogenase
MGTLTPEQIARWKHDGFLSPFPLLNAAELKECRDGLARFEQWLGAPVNEISASEDLKWRTMPYLVLPWAAKLAHDPRILDVVEDLIGPDILIFTSTFFIKEPHSPTIAAWHQDSTYYGLEPKEEVTVWVALSDANEAAGCMDALSFRGKPRQLSHVSRVVKNSVNRASQVITEPLDEGTPVAMPLAAGSFSMHHGLCAHRSGPNTANHRRIGLGLNFIPTSVRPVGSIKTAAMLVRGVDRYHHFERVEPPKAELDAASVATHERATTLYRNCYLEEEARHARLSA